MTLSKKLILPVVLGYGLLAAALYFVWAPQQLEQSRAQYLGQQQMVLQSLHTLINEAVLQDNIAEINLRLDQTWQSYETNWYYLELEQQSGRQLYTAGTPSYETTPFSTTIEERFLRDGYPVATLRADVNWSVMASANHDSVMHAEMLLLFVFMVVLIALLAITENSIRLPLMRLQQAMEHPEQEDPGMAASSEGNDEISRVARAFSKLRKGR
jgi:nitrate/nitrite-specific signal transduction histidine kinase